MPGQKILFACDLSKSGVKIIPTVVELAKKFAATLYVLSVAPDMTALSNFYPPHARFQEKVNLCTERRLEALLAEHLRGLSRVEARVLVGNAQEKILEVARQEQVELIILGTRGRTGLARLIFGSVAEGVARQAPCPVVILRAP